MENFISKISEILEVDTVKESDEMQSFEAWDSLACLSIIALADDEYGVSISAKDVTDSKTVQGLYQLIQSKK